MKAASTLRVTQGSQGAQLYHTLSPFDVEEKISDLLRGKFFMIMMAGSSCYPHRNEAQHTAFCYLCYLLNPARQKLPLSVFIYLSLSIPNLD